MDDTPDFGNSTAVIDNAISAIDTPDFSSSQEVLPPSGQDTQLSPISSTLRTMFKNTIPFEILSTAKFKFDYIQKHGEVGLEEAVNHREEDIINQGVVRQFEAPLTVATGAALIATPLPALAGLTAFAIKDHFFNARRWLEQNKPGTKPVIKDLAEILDFGATAGAIGKALAPSKDGGDFLGDVGNFIKKRFDALRLPKNVDIPTENVTKVVNSPNLLPEEKTDVAATLGIYNSHIEASQNSGLPINVPVDSVVDLTQKPYWVRAKEDLVGPIKEEVAAGDNPDLKDLQGAIAQKDLSIATMTKLKKFMDIESLKKVTPEQIKQVTSMIGDLKPGDKFLSEKQNIALDDILKTLTVPEVTPKRIIVEKFGEQDQILDKGVMSKVIPELVPTVDIKQGHPLITRIVNNARDLFAHAEKEVSRRNENFDKMMTAAEKSRKKLLTDKEKLNRSIAPQHPEIFRVLSGENIELTKEEAGAVAYLRNFFKMTKANLELDKYRKNYVTHLEKPLMEKILTNGLIPAIRETLAGQKPNDLPTDIMLELDNIIGSEKFFRFALERKGGIDPTTNLRKILNDYSNLYETKTALDKILPEGQAVTKELLNGKSALWMKKFLQNLKGRGLDNQFKTGPMAWLAKTAEGIIDIGYIKMLGFNWKSALKNVVAGEANSWIYQDFQTYIKGKQRFISEPKKSYAMAKQFGILDGTYTDYAQKGLGGLKKIQELSMIGQRMGEVEVRGSIFASMLTENEWKTGKISSDRINEIKDAIAITQGIFSKVDSPLWVQTWYGRMFMQMNRWRITNALLMRRIINEATPDIKAGNYKTQNVARLGKMVVAYGVGMYIANEFYKAGNKAAGDIAKNIAQTVDGVAALFTDGDLIKMFTDNPTLHMFKEFSNTIQNYSSYLHIPGAKSAQGKGIEDTYIAPVEMGKDILATMNQ